MEIKHGANLHQLCRYSREIGHLLFNFFTATDIFIIYEKKFFSKCPLGISGDKLGRAVPRKV